MFNWRTHATKYSDKTKPKYQRNTPEIQRLPLSLTKTIFTGTAKLPYQYSENAKATSKNGSE